MPHCIIEHSSDLEADALLKVVHDSTLASELFTAADVKTRAHAYDQFILGSGSNSFIHVTVKLLSGRTLPQRKMLSGLVFTALKDLTIPSVSITVDIVEMEKETFAKFVI